MHRDELIGFYEGSCLWLEERYRGEGLSVPLILAAAMERSQDEPPTVLPSGVDCHGYSPAGLTAHEAAFAKLYEKNYDVRAALESAVVTPPMPVPTASDSDAVRQAKLRFLADQGFGDDEQAAKSPVQRPRN